MAPSTAVVNLDSRTLLSHVLLVVVQGGDAKISCNYGGLVLQELKALCIIISSQ
jgi:hypothetical protein